MSAYEPDDDYSKFDHDIYYRQLYDGISDPDDGQTVIKIFLLDCLHEIYNSGEVHGETLLDFGTGPVIHNLVSASRHFSNIYLSDFCEGNREALWRWKKKDPGANEFSHFFKYISDKEGGNGEEPATMEDGLRSRIRGILNCDFGQSNPLSPSIYPEFDVVNSSLCLDVASPYTEEAYEMAAKNVASLVKPGGWIVLAGVLGCHRYRLGGHSYGVCANSPESLKRIWIEIGFTVEVWRQYDLSEEEQAGSKLSDKRGIFCMAAKKKDGL